MFDSYLRRWDLVSDGDPIITPAARLLPVRHHGSAAILKIATKHDERFNAVLMTWWNGDGAAQVLAHDDDALLLERAEGTASLTEMARSSRDDEACRILCTVAERLHRPRAKPLPALIPLVDWFCDLGPAAATHGGILSRCAQTAEALLAEPRDVGVLHGDLHHGNVLDFGSRGWLAIDPKRLIGERGFDFANIFTNPDIANAVPAVATDPNRFAHRLSIVAKAAELERSRLLQWILAWTGLSAAWFLNDGIDRFAAIDLIVAQLAAAELDR